MKIIKKFFYNKSFGIVLISITIFTLYGLNSTNNGSSATDAQNNLIYNGTYGLFVEMDKGLRFNWFTKNEEEGFYEIIGSDNNVIIKGETSVSKVHQYYFNKNLKKDILFRFGGKKGGTHEVRLSKTPALRKSFYRNVDSIYVIGDVHGRYDQLINLLKKSKIIDDSLNWIAGESHVVFLGDLFDRGNDVTKVLWFIYELEKKAKNLGGEIHLVLGNHEIMTMTKDLRYVSAKERAIAGAFKKNYDELFHPTKSLIGAWLRSKPSILKINDIIFAHGGILNIGELSVDDFNKIAYNNMNKSLFLDIMKDAESINQADLESWKDMRYFFYAADGPYWFRGYVNSDTLNLELDAMLNRFNSRIHVVAHTPVKTISQRYNGKLLTTDLEDAATELLLLVKDKKKHKRYKINSSGDVQEL